METEIFAICNKKGGVAKTTTAHTLGAGLSLKGYKTLIVDLDSQCNLSQAAGAAGKGKGAGDLLTGSATAGELIRSITDNLDLLPGSENLAAADTTIKDTGREYRLKEALESLPGYDFIILDCPPSLGVVTINALTAAQRIVIPAQADFFSFNAIKDLSRVVASIKKYTNPSLEACGILLTRHNPRTVFSRDITEAIEHAATLLHTGIFSATIREAVAIKEAQTAHESIFDYAPKSRVSEDYTRFIDELLKSL